jgi:hypothetical protein
MALGMFCDQKMYQIFENGDKLYAPILGDV